MPPQGRLGDHQQNNPSQHLHPAVAAGAAFEAAVVVEAVAAAALAAVEVVAAGAVVVKMSVWNRLPRMSWGWLEHQLQPRLL